MKRFTTAVLYFAVIVTAFCAYGCKSMEKTEEAVMQDMRLDTTGAYPQGLDAEIDRHGEP
jgi:hypothetical protein